MSGTPETDDLARGNHVVPTEWAQQLERERDEAREALMEIEDRCVDCEDACDDIQKIRDITAKVLEVME